jgi:hypothetical protein
MSHAQTPGLTDREATGVIIATQEDRVSVSAGDLVVLDHGRRRGVEVGDRYIVFDGAETGVHPRSGRLLHITGDAIGELSVVSVGEQTSKALVVRSMREINAGARVALFRHGDGQQSTEADERAFVQTRLTRVAPCLETTRQTIQAAEQAGTTGVVLAEVKRVLSQADRSIEQANTLMAAGDADRAATRLDSALADCSRAAELLQRTGVQSMQRKDSST